MSLRRSQIYRWHQAHGAHFEGPETGSLVSAYTSVEQETMQARQLALCDLSLLDRCGYRGAGAVGWLARSHTVPDRPNRATGSRGDALVAALSDTELLVIEPLSASAGFVTLLAERYQREPTDAWPLPRNDSHALFAVTGVYAPPMMAKLCAIDLRENKFACGDVAQTSIARLSAIVIRTHQAAVPVFYILADTSAAEYLWECLVDAMPEFGGVTIGVQALRAIA